MSDLDRQTVAAILMDIIDKGHYLLPQSVLSDAAYALHLLYKVSEQKQGA